MSESDDDFDYTPGNLAYLREKYAIGFITYEELLTGLDSVLRGGPVNVPNVKDRPWVTIPDPSVRP